MAGTFKERWLVSARDMRAEAKRLQVFPDNSVIEEVDEIMQKIIVLLLEAETLVRGTVDIEDRNQIVPWTGPVKRDRGRSK